MDLVLYVVSIRFSTDIKNVLIYTNRLGVTQILTVYLYSPCSMPYARAPIGPRPRLFSGYFR